MWIHVLTLLLWILVVVVLIKMIRYASEELTKNKELLTFRAQQVDQAVQRAEDVARLVVESENLILEHHLALVEKMNKHNAIVESNLETIQRLMHSDLIAARRDELIRTTELKVALERLVGVSTLSRQPPAVTDIMAIDSLTNRIEELELILADQTT